MWNRSFSLLTIAVIAFSDGCGGGESTGQTGTTPGDAAMTETSGGAGGTGPGSGGAPNTGGAGGVSNSSGAGGTAGSEIADATADRKTPFDATASDVANPTDAGACGSIGADCPNNMCAGNLECVDLNLGSACAPKHAMCGGIVAMDCPSDAPKCVYLSGDVGICLTQAEMNCFCNKVGGRAAGCGV